VTVEQSILTKIAGLDINNSLDLIQAVGKSLLLNKKLTAARSEKIGLACVMMCYANAMIEDCGCKIEISIKNPVTSQSVYYSTGKDSLYNFLKDLDGKI